MGEFTETWLSVCEDLCGGSLLRPGCLYVRVYVGQFTVTWPSVCEDLCGAVY